MRLPGSHRGVRDAGGVGGVSAGSKRVAKDVLLIVTKVGGVAPRYAALPLRRAMRDVEYTPVIGRFTKDYLRFWFNIRSEFRGAVVK